jgi:hypothetical protein
LDKFVATVDEPDQQKLLDYPKAKLSKEEDERGSEERGDQGVLRK